MEIRNAKISDVKAIHALITVYAERERMLFKSMGDIYETIQAFKVAVEGEKVLGCCALGVIWGDLAEVKSLAVAEDAFGKGVGRAIVMACVDQARELEIEKVFALTLEPEFFKKLGFEIVDKSTLPMKVWSDCAKCSKQDHCDEIAMLYRF